MSGGEKLYGVGAEAWRKFDAGLQAAIRRGAGPGSEFPVLITIEGMVMEGTVFERQQRMEEAAKGLEEDLKRGGARGIVKYWINWTVAVTAKLETLATIGERGDVREILLVVSYKLVS